MLVVDFARHLFLVIAILSVILSCEAAKNLTYQVIARDPSASLRTGLVPKQSDPNCHSDPELVEGEESRFSGLPRLRPTMTLSDCRVSCHWRLLTKSKKALFVIARRPPQADDVAISLWRLLRR
jgi:hypothetical protein